ncbi:MAG TPA: NAD-dependent epimerase/dehydratase family protein [Terriglobales bacterium]|jgi:UDP-glucose 4-epimerase
MSKVLITGGAGFIGSHIADACLRLGHDVVVVDDLSTGHRSNLNSDCEFHQLDIRSAELESLFRHHRFEIVSHQAALANVRDAMKNPQIYADVNVRGGVNLLECCKKYGVLKIIYASTAGCVYGEPRYLPVDERHPRVPRDPYGASKASLELYLPLYQMNYGLAYTILRYSNVFGPRQDPHGEAGVVAIFIGKMLRDMQPVINGNGEQLRDYIYVSDVVRANLAAFAHGNNEIYNLGWGRGTSVNQIFQSLRRILGSEIREVHGPAKLGEIRQIYVDARKAAEQLGWKPEIPLDQGLEQTARYFESMQNEFAVVSA